MGARRETIIRAHPPPVALMMVPLNIYPPGTNKRDVCALAARESKGYLSCYIGSQYLMLQVWIETACFKYGFQRDCFQSSSLALGEEGSEVWL